MALQEKFCYHAPKQEKEKVMSPTKKTKKKKGKKHIRKSFSTEWSRFRRPSSPLRSSRLKPRCYFQVRLRASYKTTSWYLDHQFIAVTAKCNLLFLRGNLHVCWNFRFEKQINRPTQTKSNFPTPTYENTFKLLSCIFSFTGLFSIYFTLNIHTTRHCNLYFGIKSHHLTQNFQL